MHSIPQRDRDQLDGAVPGNQHLQRHVAAGVIALRAAAGSANPAGILPTTLFATFCSTVVAIVLAKTCCSGGGRCRPAILHQGTRYIALPTVRCRQARS